METLTTVEINNYSNNLKNSLCKLYNYILKHLDNNEGIFELVNFTKEGIDFSFRNTSIDGLSNEKYVNKFLLNLDLIKELAESQPTKLIEFGIEKTDSENNKYIETYQKEFKNFDAKEMNYDILREQGSIKRMKVISEKK